MRVGIGLDVHRYGAAKSGAAIRVGGVTIPFARPVIAHSDGDPLIHAICDALLGAAGLGDIGRHFPDSDEQYQGIDSRILLRLVGQLVKERGLRVVNVDTVLVAEAPRFAPHVDTMRGNLAADLGIAEESVNIKATTTEALGFLGREEGIAAQAIVLLE